MITKRAIALVTRLFCCCLPFFVQSFPVRRVFRQNVRQAKIDFPVLPSKTAALRMKQAEQSDTELENTGNSGLSDLDELFSVAPMMGHTNRHYRYFYRLLSSRTHLYTEMIPASQIWAAYRRAREIYIPNTSAKSMDIPHPEEIMEVVTRVIRDTSLEYTAAAHFDDRLVTLHQLLATSSLSATNGSTEHPVILQIGGNDPTALSVASAIGSAWGLVESQNADPTKRTPPTYTSINLNCGCPSNAVGGRAGGCALMGTPDLVARSVESMKESIDLLWNNFEDCGLPPTVTVKHRLGIRDAGTFDAAQDRSKNDDEAFAEASSFVRTVSLAGAVPKFHVHTRLGLLGDFLDEEDSDDETNQRTKQKLWVPGTQSSENANGTDDAPAPRIKIDHKREQEKARRLSRRATIKNREVPPLRPEVVPRLADAFPHLQFVANGGIDDLDHVKKIVDQSTERSKGGVIGAMVGRTVINHPCSFSGADNDLWGSKRTAPTRGQVLEDYIAYCDAEESRIESYGASPSQLESLRIRLVAVPFHLFTGEEGSDEFQRRLKKLKDTKIGNVNQKQKKKNKKNQLQMKAASILRAAASFVPRETLNKPVDDFVPWEDVAKFDGGLKRGSALQRVIY